MSGDVTVTLKMPTALAEDGTPFWYLYSIEGMTDAEFSHTSELLDGTTGAGGLATITLEAQTLGLKQGAYRFGITVVDAQSNPTVMRTGVDVMRLLPGLEAKGSISLATYDSDQSFGITVTDSIGNLLTPSIMEGKESYTLENGATLTVTLAEPLEEGQTIEWYVDGVLDGTVNVDEASEGKYTLTFKPGSHTVTAIVRDGATAMAVGSIDPFNVVFADVGIEARMFTFELNDDEESYALTGLIQPKGEFVMPEDGVLEIPSVYNGLPVTRIASGAFEDRIDVVGSVVIPDGVISIGSSAFDGCSSLVRINIPESVTSIDIRAFSGCSALEAVEISDSSKLTSIGTQTFGGCSSLENINIPDGVTSIGWGAFQRCSSLASIIIPDGVASIREYTFTGCSALETVEFSDSSELTSIGDDAFRDCSSLASITIPEGVISIASSAFSGCSSLASINIPDGVTSIGDHTFADCSTLETVEISDSSKLTSIEEYAFFGCSSLESINIPESVTSIGSNAFDGCSSLANIYIPNGVDSIGIWVFRRCSLLSGIYCGAASQPEDWNENWLVACYAEVFWGVSRSEYDAIMNNDSIPYPVP